MSIEECILCQEKLHPDVTSYLVAGQEQGCERKKMCLNCGKKHPYFLKRDNLEQMNDNSASERPSNFTSNNEYHDQENQKPLKLKDFFDYVTLDDVKYGKCKLCDPKKITKKIKPQIKMLGGNTSGLSSHLRVHHLKVYEKLYPEKNAIRKIPKSQNTLDNYIKEQVMFAESEADANRIIVCWLAFKNLPLNFFHDNETKNFFAWINDQFLIPNKNQLSDMVLKEFKLMQENVKNILKENDSKLAFTLDGWSSAARRSYYGVTVHFIDKDWLLRSLALDFKPSQGKHNGLDVANIFNDTLELYNITDNISGITLDNVSANTTFIFELGKILNLKSDKFSVEDQHFRCLAHVINLAVQDILNLLEMRADDEDFSEEEISTDDSNLVVKIVKKVRSLHKKIRNSESLLKKLQHNCKCADVKFFMPSIDTKTRWNSTVDMLEVSFNMKDAINYTCDTNRELQIFKLNFQEWDFVENVIYFLKDFKATTEKISGEKYVTLPGSVIAINCLLDKLEKESFELDMKEDRSKVDEKLIEAYEAGKQKILKHYNKFNWVYCVSLVLDPRIKGLDKAVDLPDWVHEMRSGTIDKFKKLYKEYYDKYSSSNENSDVQHKKKKRKISTKCNINFNILFAADDDFPDWESEINSYLHSSPCKADVDVLLWWKNHQSTYPIISRMARDILCIQATSVPVERFFSEAAHVITDLRCSLLDEKIQALVCINMWMKSTLKKEICRVHL